MSTATINTDQKVNILSKAVEDMAVAMRDMALHIYKTQHDEEEEFVPDLPAEMEEMGPGEGKMGGHGWRRQAPPMIEEEEEVIEEEPPLPDAMNMNMHYQAPMEGVEDVEMEVPLADGGEEVIDETIEEPVDEPMDKPMEEFAMALAKFMKGYNNTARKLPDEESGPFGVQQSDIKGNEPQPAGRMGGTRDEETFNAGVTKLLKEVQGLRQDLQARPKATVMKAQPRPVAKATNVIPGLPNISKGRDGYAAMTPEIESEVKKRSWRELNTLREQVGDLPRNAFVR